MRPLEWAVGSSAGFQTIELIRISTFCFSLAKVLSLQGSFLSLGFPYRWVCGGYRQFGGWRSWEGTGRRRWLGGRRRSGAPAWTGMWNAYLVKFLLFSLWKPVALVPSPPPPPQSWGPQKEGGPDPPNLMLHLLFKRRKNEILRAVPQQLMEGQQAFCQHTFCVSFCYLWSCSYFECLFP